MSSRAKRKAAGKNNSAKEEAAEHQRVLGIEHEQRGRVKVEAEPEIEQRDRLTSGGDLHAVRTQRADEGDKPNEDVEHLEQQLRELALQKEEAHRARDELLEMYCPGAISPTASTHQQQRQENRPALTARRQLIKAKMEVDQARGELESTVSWVNVIKKRNPAFKKRTIRQKPTTEEMRTMAMQVEKAIADDEESLRKARQSAGLQPITEEGAEDNLQPRDALDDSEPNSEEGREPGGQGVERKNQRGSHESEIGLTRSVEEPSQSDSSLTPTGFLSRDAIRVAARVELVGETKFTGTMVDAPGLDVSHPEKTELVKAILAAPYLMIGGDESLPKGSKQLPIFVAFWDVAAQAPWSGLLRICRMEDSTAQTQAQLFRDTIVNVLGYPPHRVMYVLSGDNAASLSDEKGDSVNLLQQMLREDDATRCGVPAELQRGPGAASGAAAGDDV